MTPPPDRPTSELPTVAPASIVGLLTMLRQDQRLRWQRGERPQVEDYLRQQPSLRTNAEAVLDLIYAEFVLREELGEKPAVEEYLARFPAHADALYRQLDLHRALSSGATCPLSVADAKTRTLPPMPAPDGIAPEMRALDAAECLAALEPAAGGVAVPGYAMMGMLGKGGMGVVYKARQVSLSRVVALKMILHAEHAGDDERLRFKAEAEAVASLQHPHIVQVFEVGEHDGTPFFSLEFCPGGSLDRRLGGRPLPPREAAALVESLARAMQAAHDKGIVHRDLKPANVLLGENGVPKITDFGLAKRLDVAGLTASGAVLGTPPYMAPEQARGDGKAVGPVTDVYALGAILYELLTGRPPFNAPNPLDTLLQVLERAPAPPRLLNPAIERDLEMICLTCLEKDRARRYASAQALADDLGRYLRGESIRARSLNLVERVASVLGRSQYAPEFRGYAPVLFAFAAVVPVVETTVGVLAWNGMPSWIIALVHGFQVAVLLLVLWYGRGGRLLPASAVERHLWAVWIGYLLATVVLGAARHITAGLGMEWELDLYPFLAGLTGLAFFALGTNYWGRCFAFGLAFFALGLLMTIDLRWAPFAYGALWSTVLFQTALHLRRLDPGADGTA